MHSKKIKVSLIVTLVGLNLCNATGQTTNDYGAIYDNLQTQKLSQTDDYKFNKILPFLETGRASVQQCQDFKNLVFADNYKALSFALKQAANGGDNYNVKGVAIGGCFRMKTNHIPFAADRVPEIYNNETDMYNSGMAMARYETARSFKRDTNPSYKERRLRYFKRSADLGSVLGSNAYAGLLIDEGDKRTAFIYLNKSAEKGDRVSISALKKLYDFDFVSKAPSVKKDASEFKISRAPDSVKKTSDLSLQETPYFTRYVTANVLNERDAPNGTSVNKQYRGQLLRVYGKSGQWLRVSPNFASPRWVHADYVSSTKPPKPKPVSLNYKFSDSRVASNAIPEVGMYNLSKYDVNTIWLAAKEALDTGKCSKILDSDKSVSKANTYYLNCGRSRNTFFKRNGNQIRFLN